MTAKWTRQTNKDLKLEYMLEWKNKQLWLIYGKAFPTEDDFIEAYKDSKVVKITHSIDSKISYRSRTKTRSQLVSLLKSYRSWPEFRNEKTVERLYKCIEGGKNKIGYPIILEMNGKRRIFSGNTRADVAMQTDGFYEAILIKV